MKEPHRKGVAHRTDPEPCAGGREAAGEALGRGTRRRGIELRNQRSGAPTTSACWEGNTVGRVLREQPTGTTESKTLCMRGNSMRENRETPQAPHLMAGRAGW